MLAGIAIIVPEEPTKEARAYGEVREGRIGEISAGGDLELASR